MAVIELRVLTWNLMHGRAVPGAGRDLFFEFADALGGWECDVALLQEVPPWWPAQFAARLGVDFRLVLTSRNSLLGLRRAVAVQWPDLIKSNGGGCNAILVRGLSVVEHRVARLRWVPERRWVHGVRLGPGGVWVANVHAQASARDALAAARAVAGWAGPAPCVLGGDFNLRADSLPQAGFEYAGGSGVDHVLVRRWRGVGGASVLDHGRPSGGAGSSNHARLSDHAPVLAVVGPSEQP